MNGSEAYCAAAFFMLLTAGYCVFYWQLGAAGPTAPATVGCSKDFRGLGSDLGLSALATIIAFDAQLAVEKRNKSLTSR